MGCKENLHLSVKILSFYRSGFHTWPEMLFLYIIDFIVAGIRKIIESKRKPGFMKISVRINLKKIGVYLCSSVVNKNQTLGYTVANLSK